MSDAVATPSPISVRSIIRSTSLGELLTRRWAATWIDFVVLASLLLGPDYFLGNKTYQATIFFWLAAIALYFPFFEALWGRSIGKLIAGVAVVDSKGKPPGFGKATLRTLTRPVEVNPFLAGGLPAGIAVWNSKDRQRLGDMWADTYVIPSRRLAELRRVNKAQRDRRLGRHE